jgi:hypothetical protein
MQRRILVLRVTLQAVRCSVSHGRAVWYGVVYGECCGENHKYGEIGRNKLIGRRTIRNLYQSMMGNDGRITNAYLRQTKPNPVELSQESIAGRFSSVTASHFSLAHVLCQTLLFTGLKSLWIWHVKGVNPIGSRGSGVITCGKGAQTSLDRLVAPNVERPGRLWQSEYFIF